MEINQKVKLRWLDDVRTCLMG